MYKKIYQKSMALIGTILIICMSFANMAWALPKDGKVVEGKSIISQPDSAALSIKQKTDKSIINWNQYSISTNETVRYEQPRSSSISLNRVTGADPSAILGQLFANGQVWVINPNGLLVGKDAKINVGSFLGSTLDINDKDFLKGNYKFIDASSGTLASVTNLGKINADKGGYVAILSPSITNEGSITANSGGVYLASGKQVTINFAKNELIGFTIDEETAEKALGITNTGAIIANGGQIILSAKSAGDLFKTVINNEGIIQARTIKNKKGVIQLLGGLEDNSIRVRGTLDASAPDGGDGGFIETSAAKVKVANDVNVTTSTSNGVYGLWLIDPQNYTVAASGGDITGATLSTNLATTSIALQSSTGGTAGSGNVNISDEVSWSANSTLTLTASNNVNINSDITATGNTAGLVIRPNTANGSEAATGTGVYNLNSGAVITLSGSTPSLSIAGQTYTVINEAKGGVTALQNMNNNRAGYYALGSDINATTTSTWNGGDGFAPIGKNSGQSFTGKFDGLGHTITNITIKPAGGPGYVGLFGNVDGGTIKNVGLVNANVMGKQYVGGLVGNLGSGTINNVYVTGSVAGGNSNANSSIGGLIGNVQAGTVSNSYATSSVTGSDLQINVGALIGNNGGTVNNSYATGSVTGTGSVTTNVGGLVGNNAGTVGNAYAVGHVTGTGGTTNVGGLIGNNAGSVTSSYWDTETSGQSTSAGGTGLTTAQMMTMSSFSGWNIANTGGTSAVWRIYEDYTYPLLRDFLVPITVTPEFNGPGTYTNIAAYTTNLAGYDVSKFNTTTLSLMLSSSATPGTATASLYGGIWSSQDGYDINTAARTLTGTGSNANDLRIGQSISWSSGRLILNAANNIVIDSTMNGSGTAQLSMLHGQGAVAAGNTATYTVNAPVNLPAGYNFFTKLGSDGATKTYRVITNLGAVGSTTAADLQGMNGNLAGNYALGSNIDASATSGWNGGLGFTPIGNNTTPFTGTFEGLGHIISDLSINRPTESYVGLFGIIGSDGTVRNVGLMGGSVSGNMIVGGLAGRNFGTVENSYATGSVSGVVEVGGLVGYNIGTVKKSNTTSNVSGSDDVGGIVGQNRGTISNSHATGNVNGNYYVGNLVGYNNTGIIEESYSTGSATGTKYVGGVLGYNKGTVEKSYAMGSVNGVVEVGGLVGYNSSMINNSHSTASVIGSDDVGGIVGQNRGTISNSHATGSVNGNFYVGDLVGYNRGTVEKSYATGSVFGYANVGGLIGYNRGNVENSYTTGSVIGTRNVGGLVGFNSSTITNTYATGLVNNSVAKTTVGGLVGYNVGSTTNSFWDIETTGQSVSAGGTRKTTAEMQTASTFTDAGWDTTNIWNINSYPTLK